MTAKNTQVEKTNEDQLDTTDATVVDVPEVETVTFEVELANGNKVMLEAIKDREELPFELLEHAQRGNYAVFLNGALTKKSLYLLNAYGAKVRDYEAVSVAYGAAVGAIEED